MRKIVSAFLFVAACLAIGALSRVANTPAEWYQSLDKPFFQPPDWLFAPVWAGLYILIGLALAETWLDRREPRTLRLIVFAIQGILNILWSPVFFGMRSPALGLIVIVLMLAFILVHCNQLATQPQGGIAVYSLRGLGRLRSRTQSFDRHSELIQNTSLCACRLSARMPLSHRRKDKA